MFSEQLIYVMISSVGTCWCTAGETEAGRGEKREERRAPSGCRLTLCWEPHNTDQVLYIQPQLLLPACTDVDVCQM